ncbi:MAG: electron transfer flavoprotein subunit beta/FixA family protein [Spirochaetaceae bacterium]|nr:electron transfer flavoprotein subunit beta/FixA family protein [Spirochaetaceae bacterium]
MKILVLVKQVPETDSLAIDPETGTVVRSEATSIVNPLDLYALEAALAIKDTRAEARITALSMGPPAAAVALKEAVAMGCDDAVLVTGREFAGADTWATARTLAAAIRRLGPFDLVFCGEKATDGDTGQVGPEVAAFLDLPVVTYAGAVELRDGPGGLVVRAERVSEDCGQIVECAAPLVLSFCKAVGEPRLPLLAGKKRAHDLAPRLLGLAELGLPAEEAGSRGSPTRVVRIASPRLTRETESLDARSEEGAEAACRRIVELLAEKGLVVPKDGAGREGRVKP